MITFEDYGFCQKGEGKDFVKNGRIEVGGELPVNTHGGLLSQAHIEGMLHVTEAVRQLRGNQVEPERQVKNAKTGIVSGHGGSLCMHATLILGALRATQALTAAGLSAKSNPFSTSLKPSLSGPISESTNSRLSAAEHAANYSPFRRKARARTAFRPTTNGCRSAAKAKSTPLSATTAPGTRPTKAKCRTMFR